MHLILTGATGTVGGACLHAMLRDESVTKISILSRRPVALASSSPKCTVILHRDFSEPPSPEVLARLNGAKGCVWALGISVNDVDKDRYRQITVDYPLKFVQAFTKHSEAQFNFVYVSGEGATTEPSAWTPRFGVVKGHAEKALLEISKKEEYSKLNVYSARPGAVDPGQHPDLQANLRDRQIPLWRRLVEHSVLTIMRPLFPSMVSPTKELGDAMVQLATGDGKPFPEGVGISGEGRTLANAGLRRLVGI